MHKRKKIGNLKNEVVFNIYGLRMGHLKIYEIKNIIDDFCRD